MKKIKICVVGNSVAIRIRPKDETGAIFSTVLKELLVQSGTTDVSILNLSISRLLTQEVVDQKEHFLDNGQDITIVNLGCVDAPTREIPLWFSDIIFKRKGQFLYSIFDPIYKHLITKFRPSLVALRGYKPWVPLDEFSINIKEIILSLKDKSNIIVLGINPGSQRIEKNLPQTLLRYKIYNEKLKSICENEEVTFIDTSDLNSKDFFPDGVHYNKLGHKVIANRIYNQLNLKL